MIEDKCRKETRQLAAPADLSNLLLQWADNWPKSETHYMCVFIKVETEHTKKELNWRNRQKCASAKMCVACVSLLTFFCETPHFLHSICQKKKTWIRRIKGVHKWNSVVCSLSITLQWEWFSCVFSHRKSINQKQIFQTLRIPPRSSLTYIRKERLKRIKRNICCAKSVRRRHAAPIQIWNQLRTTELD